MTTKDKLRELTNLCLSLDKMSDFLCISPYTIQCWLDEEGEIPDRYIDKVKEYISYIREQVDLIDDRW